MRQQEEALKNFRDPFKQEGARGGKTGNASFPGSVQGASPAQPSGSKHSGKPG
jgi:hypothetical protein